MQPHWSSAAFHPMHTGTPVTHTFRPPPPTTTLPTHPTGGWPHMTSSSLLFGVAPPLAVQSPTTLSVLPPGGGGSGGRPFQPTTHAIAPAESHASTNKLLVTNAGSSSDVAPRADVMPPLDHTNMRHPFAAHAGRPQLTMPLSMPIPTRPPHTLHTHAAGTASASMTAPSTHTHTLHDLSPPQVMQMQSTHEHNQALYAQQHQEMMHQQQQHQLNHHHQQVRLYYPAGAHPAQLMMPMPPPPPPSMPYPSPHTSLHTSLFLTPAGSPPPQMNPITLGPMGPTAMYGGGAYFDMPKLDPPTARTVYPTQMATSMIPPAHDAAARTMMSLQPQASVGMPQSSSSVSHTASPSFLPFVSRVTCACSNCKKAKTRCDNARPCGRCRRLGRENTCVDSVHQRRGRSGSDSAAKKRTHTDMNTDDADESVEAADEQEEPPEEEIDHEGGDADDGELESEGAAATDKSDPVTEIPLLTAATHPPRPAPTPTQQSSPSPLSSSALAELTSLDTPPVAIRHDSMSSLSSSLLAGQSLSTAHSSRSSVVSTPASSTMHTPLVRPARHAANTIATKDFHLRPYSCETQSERATACDQIHPLLTHSAPMQTRSLQTKKADDTPRLMHHSPPMPVVRLTQMTHTNHPHKRQATESLQDRRASITDFSTAHILIHTRDADGEAAGESTQPTQIHLLSAAAAADSSTDDPAVLVTAITAITAITVTGADAAEESSAAAPTSDSQVTRDTPVDSSSITNTSSPLTVVSDSDDRHASTGSTGSTPTGTGTGPPTSPPSASASITRTTGSAFTTVAKTKSHAGQKNQP